MRNSERAGKSIFSNLNSIVDAKTKKEFLKWKKRTF